MKNLFTILCVCLLFIQNPFSQSLPDNFEFLDHSTFSSNRIGASHHVSEGLLYVNHRDQDHMTTVGIATADNKIINLFKSPFRTDSKKVVHGKDHIVIYLYDFWDYDINPPGFYVIEYKDGELDVREFATFNSSQSSRIQVRNIYPVTDNSWLIDAFGELLILNDSEEEFPQADEVLGEIYVNQQQQIYNFTNNNLFLLSQGIFEVDKVFDAEIYDIWSHGNYNVVLQDEKIQVYEYDFKVLIKEYEIPSEVKNRKQIILSEDFDLKVLYERGEEFRYSSFSQNQEENIYIGTIPIGEFSYGVHENNEGNFLIEGFSKEYNEQIFFRNIPIFGVPNYAKADAEILKFEIIEGQKEVASTIVQNGDTIYYYHTPYDISIEVQNNTEEIVEALDLFTNRWDTWAKFGDGRLTFTLDGSIDPGEVKTFDSTYITYTFVPDDLDLFCTGANYRFNANGPSILRSDFSVSTSEIVEHSELKIFPNPSHGFVNLNTEKDIINVFIYDLSGQLVYRGFDHSGFKQINLEALSKGSYIIKAFDKEHHLHLAKWLKN